MSAVTAPMPSSTEPVGERARRLGIRALLLTPAFVWVIVLIILPNLFMIFYSLWENSLGDVSREWSVDNYTRAFNSDVVQVALTRTFIISVAAAGIATAIAYPLAYLVVRRLGRFKVAAALLILVPLWVSYLMRVFAWRIILGERGVLNGALTSLGIIDEPSGAFLYSTGTVILTLTYVAIPYVFLATYVMLERIPENIYEASGDCGASAWRTFRHVIWPLSRPGAVVGFIIGFVLAFGDYVTPAMVGGLKGTMVGSLVLQQFGYGNNWPFGAAIAITILLTALVFLAVMSLFTRTEARFE
jgi:spermidine/putrescine transport system permease protein